MIKSNCLILVIYSINRLNLLIKENKIHNLNNKITKKNKKDRGKSIV